MFKSSQIINALIDSFTGAGNQTFKSFLERFTPSPLYLNSENLIICYHFDLIKVVIVMDSMAHRVIQRTSGMCQ